jgi:hypothetical protein
MANGKIPNINNKFYGEKLVEVTFPDSTSSLGFDEYNAVLNNVNSSVSSSIIMDADYALNARIPTNNDRLLSGTAQRMEIQDSNYSSVAWTSPRYVGSQTVSATYNDYQASGSSVTFADGTVGAWKGDQVFNEYPGDETFTRGNPLGKVPAVDLYSTHFVLFDRINIDNALFNRDVFHCLYLIDDQGNKKPLSYKNKNLVDLQRLFIQGSNAEVVFLGQNNQELLDEYPIGRVGITRQKEFSIENDIYTTDNSSAYLYPANMSPNSPGYVAGSGTATTQFAFIFSKYGNQLDKPVVDNCYAGIPITPSLFSSSLEPNGDYKLSYSTSGSEAITTRNSLIDANFNIGCSHQFNYKSAQGGFVIKIANYKANNVITFYDSSTPTNPPPNTLVNATGSYINAPNSITSSNYKLNENKLDPFYVFTYNPETSRVFENTIYETVIHNAQFASTNPLLYNNERLGDIINPQLSYGTLDINIPSPAPMEPLSTLGGESGPSVNVGSSISWADANINNSIPTNIIDNDYSNITEIIREQLPSFIKSETEVTEINIGETDLHMVYHWNTNIVNPGVPNGPSGYYGAGGGIVLGMGADSYNSYFASPSIPMPGGGTYIADPEYPDNRKYRYTDSSISSSLQPVSENDYLSCGMIVANKFSYMFSTSNANFQKALGRPNMRWDSIHPGNVNVLYLPAEAGKNIGNSFYGTADQSDFYETLSHGDIIELTDSDLFFYDMANNTTINNLTDPSPNNPYVWRFMILRAPDNYKDDNVNGGGSGEGNRGCYRFYVRYINGRTDNLAQDPILYTVPAGLDAYPQQITYTGTNIGVRNNLSFGPNLSFGYNPISTTFNSRRVITLFAIRRMKDPYIKVRTTAGDNIGNTINDPSTILSIQKEKIHEQYIESQNLIGTGVGVLLPNNYDPKLREQLPDIINKTGIDINSLVQGNN